MTLEPYQTDAVRWLAIKRRAVVVAPAGSGKTVIAAATVQAVVNARPRDRAIRVGWLANTQEQCQQAHRALDHFPCRIDRRIACAASATDWSDRDVLIVDECLTAGTMIGVTRIEHLKTGDVVDSWNHESKQIEPRVIRRVFKSRPSSLMTVTMTDGSELQCTIGHPFWNGTRYVPAFELTRGAMVYRLTTHEHNLQRVRNGLRAKESARTIQGKSWVRDAVLRKMPQGKATKSLVGDDGANQPKARLCQNEIEQPDAEKGNTGKNVSHAAIHRTSSDNKGRKRQATFTTGDDSSDGSRMANLSSGEDRNEARKRVSSSLQNRRGERNTDGRNRDRRRKSLLIEAAGAGHKKNGTIESAWVESITFHQQTGDGEFGGMCPGGHVYNIEVEGNHNYFANGILVHNCHHASAPGWRAQIETCQGARWGFTATPDSEDPERNQALVELFGLDRHVIGRESVARRLAHARVVMLDATDPDLKQPIDAKIAKDMIWRRRFWRGDEGQLWGQVAWQACIELGIVANRARNDAAVAAALAHRGEAVLMLVNQIEHGAALCERIPGARLCHSKMGAKARREAMEAFRAGNLWCIIGTSLLDEGTDLPRANVLVLVSGGRSSARTEQRTGRVLRAFAGKSEGIIYDFTDTQHPLMAKHSRRRVDVYRGLDYEVVDTQPQLGQR